MSTIKVHYKYRTYSAQSLEVFILKEIYFSPPSKLNDPYDCQVSVRDGLREAIENAIDTSSTTLLSRLERFQIIDHVYEQIEHDANSAGIFSLSRDPINVLMWSHYAANHTGFCVGFRLSDRFTTHNNTDGIAALSQVNYSAVNPFTIYFDELAKSGHRPAWADFWSELLAIGMITKANSWAHEKEARIIRKHPGPVSFDANEISEVIFGMNMPDSQRNVIRSLLSSREWNHIQFKEVKRSRGFNVELHNVT
jgi:hypothetical protein